MAVLPYTNSTTRLVEFIETIPERGVPEKVTVDHLNSLGYTSSNDRSIISVLKYIGILNDDGTPSESYRDFRTVSKGKKRLAQLLKASYDVLYDVYPAAQDMPADKIRAVIASATTVGGGAQAKMLQTFNALKDYADWSGLQDDRSEDHYSNGQNSTLNVDETTHQIAVSGREHQHDFSAEQLDAVFQPSTANLKIKIEAGMELETVKYILTWWADNVIDQGASSDN